MGNWSRRETMTAGAAIGAALAIGGAAGAASGGEPPMTTYRDPGCSCCGKWVDLARAAGYPVKVVATREMIKVKDALEVPAALGSCHTTRVGGYVVEGHVPFAAVAKLLRARPAGVIGIAVPGMPAGSPGMEVHGQAPAKGKIRVYAFNKAGAKSEFSY